MSQYIGNAFSLQMLGDMSSADIKVERIDGISDEVESSAVSVVGHPDTAKVLGVEFRRVSLTLKKGDVLYVAQLVGGRLPEGATTLPDGFKFVWFKVSIL